MGCYGNTLQASRSITIDTDWTSLDGAGRYDTMKKIVAAGWTSKTDTVIVATGGNFPDELAASSLAGIKDAPVVSLPQAILSKQAKSTIEGLSQTTSTSLVGTVHFRRR